MDVHRTLYSLRGAVTAVARELDISDAAVSQWKKRGIPTKRIPEVAAVLERLQHADDADAMSAAPEADAAAHGGPRAQGAA